MSKTLRRSKPKRRSRPATPRSRPSVSRREYAEVVLRLGSIELQVQRNRAELELHAQRIADLQELVRSLNKATLSPALSNEIPPLPLPPKPTVES